MYNWIGDGLPFLCAVFALIWCNFTKLGRNKALFPKLVAAGIACTALGYLHNLVYYFIVGSASAGFYISFLGIIGFYIFLLSASYGQLDGLFDDGGAACRKARFLAIIAPVAINLLFLFTLFSKVIPTWMKVVDYVGWLPIIFASYYNLKHALLPDGGFAFVKAVRPYNIVAVVLEFLQALYLTTRAFDYAPGVAVCSILLGLAMIALMYFAKKGADLWTI